MPRKRNEELNEATVEAIKQTARRLMAEEGTNGLSIRGIAKALELTPPAIYHYFSSLDDLTTVLIADSFNALADALEASLHQSAAPTAAGKLFDVLLAYRQWAVDHPVDFQLIYGNPIPGFVAPREVTVPAVVRTFVPTVSLIDEALRTGQLQPLAPYDQIPPPIADHLQRLIADGGYPIATLSMYLAMILWSHLHGIIYLELFNHIQPNVGDVDLFYQTQLRALLLSMGLRI